MTPEFKKLYEFNHLAMKQWNDNRAKAEEEGLKKFYALKEQFKEFAKKQRL
jgi:hypothetical protein